MCYVVLRSAMTINATSFLYMWHARLQHSMSSLKNGVRCQRCDKIFFDKSTFNRHHSTSHKGEAIQFECNVAYMEVNGSLTSDIEWAFKPLPQPSAKVICAPGMLERQTKILSKALDLFDDPKWGPIGDPSVTIRDECVSFMDKIDDFALVASTLIRAQVMRSKMGCLKARPFQPLKDTSGAQYAVTLARFVCFARVHFDKESASVQDCVYLALLEKCTAIGVCCLEGFVMCLTVHAPSHKNADPLQHAAMHMRRVLRGGAMLYLSENPDVACETFCDTYLNVNKAASFAVLSSLYYQIKRCVPHDKRLLIHRSDPDEGFPQGSAVLVSSFYVAHIQRSADCCSAGRHRPGIGQSDVYHDAMHHQHDDSGGV